MIASLVLTTMLVAQATPTPPTPPAPPAEIGTRAQSAQTATVSKGMRLQMDACNGDVIVDVWNRDEVRLQATHSRRIRVRLDVRPQVVFVETDSTFGPGSADVTLTVPAWMSLQLAGRDCFVDVDGVTGGLRVETLEGDIRLRNVGGAVSAKTIDGNVVVDNSRGRLELRAVDGDITITKSQGEIAAEAVDGSIIFVDCTPSALEASSVDGDISFSGAFQGSGRYLLSTHDGNIDLSLPENTNATFGIRASNANRVDTTLPLKQSSTASRGRRSVYTLGSGAAQVELESFDGDVRIGRR